MIQRRIIIFFDSDHAFVSGGNRCEKVVIDQFVNIMKKEGKS